MIKFACCIPGGSLMPEGVAEVPASPAEDIVRKCRYLLDIGYDMTECSGGMLSGLNDEEIKYLTDENSRSPLGLVAVNSMFPGSWRLSDPASDKDEYLRHAEKILAIMEKLGAKYAVFGSGAARWLHSDCDSEKSRKTLYDFVLRLAELAKKYGVMLLIEPLRHTESNIFVTVPECGEFIKSAGNENLRLLCDAFHMAEEKTPIASALGYLPLVRHCHISEAPMRVIPGKKDSADLSYNVRFLAELEKRGYDGCVSVECFFDDFTRDSKSALEYMKEVMKMEKTVFRFKAVRDMTAEPVFIRLAEGEIPAGMTSLICGDNVFPASKKGDGVIAVISAKRGEELTMTAASVPVGGCSAEALDDRIDMKINGKHFSDYVFKGQNKPYFGQIVDENGVGFTRLDLTAEEHPHQRSLIIAVGDVNGVDCWNEYGNYGLVKNESVMKIVSSSAYASFTAHNRWTDLENKPLLSERTTYTVYNQPNDARVLDIETVFKADYGDFTFGATKEAGPLGIRLRDELKVDSKQSKIKNSWGAETEAECWGKCAEWCDYYGDLDGIGPMGVTIFDNMKNERFPTAWHVRSYGLFAANNLFFKGGFTVKAGESVTYRYRVIFRRREMTNEEISNRYVIYSLT